MYEGIYSYGHRNKNAGGQGEGSDRYAVKRLLKSRNVGQKEQAFFREVPFSVIGTFLQAWDRSLDNQLLLCRALHENIMYYPTRVLCSLLLS